MNRLTPNVFLDDDVDAHGRPLPPRPITRLHPRRSQWRTDHALRDGIVTHTDPDWSSSSMPGSSRRGR